MTRLLVAMVLSATSTHAISAGQPERGDRLELVAYNSSGPAPQRAEGAGLNGTEHRTDTMVVALMLDGKTVKTIAVKQGDQVRLELRTPVLTELHLHGYDLTASAGPVEPALFVFEARRAGRFSIGAHRSKDLLGRREAALAYVEVRPE